MDFRKTIFKHLQFRFINTSREAKFIIMVFPTFVFGTYNETHQWRYSFIFTWLNWSAGFMVYRQSDYIVS